MILKFTIQQGIRFLRKLLVGGEWRIVSDVGLCNRNTSNEKRNAFRNRKAKNAQ